MSDGLSQRLLGELDSLEDQVKRAYEITYGRKPDQEELKLGINLSKTHGLDALSRVLFNSNEFVVIE